MIMALIRLYIIGLLLKSALSFALTEAREQTREMYAAVLFSLGGAQREIMPAIVLVGSCVLLI